MRAHVALSFGPLMLAGALAATACGGGEATPQAAGRGRGQQDGPVAVTTTSVVTKSVPIQLAVIGTVEAYSTVAIRAQTTGELTSVNFREGDDVRKGQVLFTLDRRPLEAALQQAEANLAKDQAQAANARAQVVRYQDLLKRGIATHEQADQITTNATALDATVGADRAAVENAKVQLQYATIMAPISGRTGALMVHAGNLVRANDTAPLVVINQITPIYVDFAVPEARMAEVKRYMADGTINVTAAPPNDTAPPATGRITFIDNQVDQTTGTIKLKGTFANGNRSLWPGQFVNVVVTLTHELNATVVPSAAVQSGPQGNYVFVVKPDETVDLRPIVVERTNGDDSVIRQGLKPGETVVTDGQLRLVAGSRITIKNAGSRVTP
ncbi:MAG: efflux RND transporter periplasmic adaptor subunit [Betaproteobacteria bacterium]